jgi:hypothetical protein
MRRAISIAVATTTLFSISPSQPTAYAENMPLPAPSLSPFEQYRIDRENYFAAMREITSNFKVACDTANSNYLASIAIAKSKDQKRAARIARESAITQAAIEFENAKNELGPMPVEPQRMVKPPSKNKVKSR